MFDKEIEAIAKCTELIKDLDEEAKVRVIKYLIERFGIGSGSTNYVVMQSNSAQTVQITDGHKPSHFVDAEPVDYPSLKQLVIKNYPKNEPEWILCYAFFASKYGNETFTKEDVVEGYKESNRYTSSNKNNLTNNFNACIKKDWIKDVNKNEFILKPDGISYAQEILNGNSTSKEVKKRIRNRKVSDTSSENGMDVNQE